jgi:hypothetical protein
MELWAQLGSDLDRLYKLIGDGPVILGSKNLLCAAERGAVREGSLPAVKRLLEGGWVSE